MLRTNRILILNIVISPTILGLAIIFKGCFIEIQAGKDNRILLEALTTALGLIATALGLATAYLNFRAAEKLAQSRDQVRKRFWPWG